MPEFSDFILKGISFVQFKIERRECFFYRVLLTGRGVLKLLALCLLAKSSMQVEI